MRSDDKRLKHGKRHTPEYACWRGMKGRCYLPSNKTYHNYGGRGIKVCDRWLNSFQAFFGDLGERPSPQHSIERIDTNGNYEPGNCRWATAKEQGENRRDTRWLTYDGKSLCMADWANLTGIPVGTIWHRLNSGWSIEAALTKPRYHREIPSSRVFPTRKTG